MRCEQVDYLGSLHIASTVVTHLARNNMIGSSQVSYMEDHGSKRKGE